MRRRDEGGAVTAEAAVVLPVLVILTAALAWLVAFGVSQARVVDAARETARAMARGESAELGQDLGRRIAPSGARFTIGGDERTVSVTVVVRVRGPGGIFGSVPGADARATAVALRESGS